MRKNMWSWAIVGMACLTFFTGPLVPMADEDKPGMEGEMNGGAEQAGKMKERLGLTDEQAAKVKDLFKKNWEASKPLRDQMKIDMDTLQQKVDTKASDGEVQKILDALSADRKKMDSTRQQMEDQLKGVLSPTQRAKFVLGMKGRGKRMIGRWMKHRKDRNEKGKSLAPDDSDSDQNPEK